MDTESTKDANGCVNNPMASAVPYSDGGKAEDHANGEDDSDSNALLAPLTGGMSRKPDNTHRKVQWNDKNGNKLVEVLEYEPSDVSDSEEEEEEDEDSCMCTIM